MIRKGPIGKPSGNYVHQKIEVVWGSRISTVSIWLCLQNQSGELSTIQTRYLRSRWETSSGEDEKWEFFHLAEYARGAGLL